MVTFIFKDPSKSLSRNVVCHCEPILVILALASIKFLPEIVENLEQSDKRKNRGK